MAKVTKSLPKNYDVFLKKKLNSDMISDKSFRFIGDFEIFQNNDACILDDTHVVCNVCT